MNRTAAYLILIPLASAVVLRAESLPSSKSVAIGNFCGLDTVLIEQLRHHAESQLHVPVRSFDKEDTGIKEITKDGPSLAKYKNENDVCLIALVSSARDSQLHAYYLTNANLAIVNVSALRSDDPMRQLHRLQKQVMRGAGVMFGLKSDPDPHCVMHDYVTLADLDNIGTNFSPPWLDMFLDAARRRGLTVQPLTLSFDEVLKRQGGKLQR